MTEAVGKKVVYLKRISMEMCIRDRLKAMQNDWENRFAEYVKRGEMCLQSAYTDVYKRQDLNKAVNRLNSLQNGGPVEETDAGTDADNLNSKTGRCV